MSGNAFPLSMMSVMEPFVTKRDLDMSAIECHLSKIVSREKVERISHTLADSMLDGIDILMSDDTLISTTDGVDCVLAQAKFYGLEEDKVLRDLVEDQYLAISIEAGVRSMDWSGQS